MGKAKIKNPIILFLLVQIRFYQLFISPLMGLNCRFYPSCSQYCLESLKKFGLFKGIYYSFLRIKECHPFGKSGFDPVKNKIVLKKVSLKDIKPHRKKNLYNMYSSKLSNYKEDKIKSTVHYALFSDKKLVSGATLIEKSDDNNTKIIQIRGMFTVKDEINKGYGSNFISMLIKEMKKNKIKFVWCNSRIVAVNFYKKNQFDEIGNYFNILHIGKHKKLIRYL